MKVRMFRLFSLISLLVIPGICSQEWEIQYLNMMKCVLKGSTTRLSGIYKHPDRLTVTEIFWTVNPVKDKENINLLNLPDYRDRVQYFHNKDKTFILTLSNVRLEDEGMYCLRIVTNKEREKYLGFPGIELRVTELRVEIPEEVVEKDSPVLFCNTTCILSGTDFIWYRNGKRLSERSGTNQLLLQSVSSDDTGNYSCAARDQEHLPSPAVTLSVRYPPKSVSVSISPSGEIVSGDSVTLNCSSDSNPPALNFSWFKENETSAVGSGQSFSISSFNSSFSGRFYCEAQNKYGSQRSASVSLSVSFAGGRTAGLYAAAGIGAALICICIIFVVIKIIRKTGDSGVRGGVSKQNPNMMIWTVFIQENSSAAVTDQMSTSDSGVQNDVIYSSIDHNRPRKHQSAGDEDELQYASVHHHRNTGITSVKAEGPSGDVRDLCPADSVRSDDSSVIYSSINVA
ncbi:B-cell receptor CD22-like isoform X2 [Chanodichthys erythropterus]|uniref:B-cell receptor CD22-like isoform X2 n=1 Tax=Chanodichthys erythropterus TaxID=933992 RepID=UPI00351E38A6